ncbi:MAG: lipoprotein, partial [Clostridia bacterium]|nr:lipoprotein [Clostridia bacterium]
MKKLLSVLTAVLLLAGCLAGCGGNAGSYSDLSMIEGVELGVEEYGIAWRSGSDMVAKVDAISAELFTDGTIKAIAEKYDQTDNIVTTFVPSTDSNPTGDSDWEYIKAKGKLVIGVTLYDPMNYKDENG